MTNGACSKNVFLHLQYVDLPTLKTQLTLQTDLCPKTFFNKKYATRPTGPSIQLKKRHGISSSWGKFMELASCVIHLLKFIRRIIYSMISIRNVT